MEGICVAKFDTIQQDREEEYTQCGVGRWGEGVGGLEENPQLFPPVLLYFYHVIPGRKPHKTWDMFTVLGGKNITLCHPIILKIK